MLPDHTSWTTFIFTYKSFFSSKNINKVRPKDEQQGLISVKELILRENVLSNEDKRNTTFKQVKCCIFGSSHGGY